MKRSEVGQQLESRVKMEKISFLECKHLSIIINDLSFKYDLKYATCIFVLVGLLLFRLNLTYS